MGLPTDYKTILDEVYTLEAGDMIEGDCTTANVADYVLNIVEEST